MESEELARKVVESTDSAETSDQDCTEALENVELSETRIDEIIERIDQDPDSAKEEIRHILRYSSYRQWSAPLPHPAQFGEYGKYVADAPERILRMTEKEQDNRIALNRMLAESTIEEEKRLMTIREKDSDWERKMQGFGFLIAFILASLFFISAMVFLNQGKEVGGFVSLATGIAIIVGPFIYWKTKPNEEAK